MDYSNFSQLKLTQLRPLVAVADQGNFGETALEPGISQSAVNYAIATPEATLELQTISTSEPLSRSISAVIVAEALHSPKEAV